MRKEQKRSLWLLSVIAILLFAVYIILPDGRWETQEGKENLIVYSVDRTGITGIQFGGKGNRISLLKKEDGWGYAEDEGFPLNQNFVDTMLKKTAQLTAKYFVAEGREYFEEYGLNQPDNTILVTGASWAKTIYLGKTNSATGDSYMAVEGSEKIYTVDSTFSNLFSSSLNDMAVRESLPGFNLNYITNLTVAHGDRKVMLSRQEGQGLSGWNVSENKGAALSADEGLVSQLLGKLVKIKYEEMAVYHPSKSQLEEYGLSEGSLIQVFYQDEEKKTELEFVLRMGKNSDDGLSTYVYPEGGQGIYAVKKTVLEPFSHLVPEDLLSLSVAPVKVESLEGLILSWADGQAEFHIDRPNGGQNPVYILNGREITEGEFNGFYYPLYGLMAEKRVADMAGQLTGASVLTIEYRKIEGTEEDMTVELIPYDQNYYGAKVNGKSFLLVNRQRVNSLINEIKLFILKE